MKSVTSNAVASAINNSIINMTGTFTVELSANGFDNVAVNFPNSLPNINYCLSFQPIATRSILFSVMNRYNSSAVVNVRNLNDSALTVNCNWFLICKR